MKTACYHINVQASPLARLRDPLQRRGAIEKLNFSSESSDIIVRNYDYRVNYFLMG